MLIKLYLYHNKIKAVKIFHTLQPFSYLFGLSKNISSTGTTNINPIAGFLDG